MTEQPHDPLPGLVADIDQYLECAPLFAILTIVIVGAAVW